MEIHFALNDKHYNMFNAYCKPSIPHGFTIVEHKLDIKSSGEYMKNGYIEIIREKMRLIINSLNSLDSPDPIIWADADIVFSGKNKNNFIKLILLELEKSNKSILYQKEHLDSNIINGGFFIAKKNDFTKKLYSYILQSCLSNDDKHDQDYINEFIVKNCDEAKEHIGTLPRVYASASNRGFQILTKCQLFHCNCTATVNDKIKMMKRVSAKIS